MEEISRSGRTEAQDTAILVEWIRDPNDPARTQRAWSALWNRYGPELLVYARLYSSAQLRQRVDERRIVHEAFVRIWNSFNVFTHEKKGDLLAWLKSQMRFAVLDLVRDARPQRETVALAAEPMAERNADGASQLEQAEILQRLVASLEELSETYRELVILRRFEGKSYEEIAAAVGLQPATARRYVNRGLENWRKILGRDPESDLARLL